ncbi:hypothetical protein [Arenimonas sp. GDDSR-1]|uniref:hypothetical protein n=1 Tax=Arenimonas sp. GDDSR-1 TaxID=2950125 RepID=UPI0026184071|nr:hypothetical protein [Arenimonas sp. GDDSR-1]
MPRLHIFIISWNGQHARAAAIAGALNGVGESVSIVYSDPDPDTAPAADCRLIRRDDTLFWADKFSACLEHLAPDADILLVIHADCDCDDWAGLVAGSRAAHRQFPRIAVWAPLITVTPYPLKHTLLGSFFDTPMKLVAQTDGIVFSLSKAAIARMRSIDYRKNLYGWGIDWVFMAFAYANKQFAVVDPRVRVRHPESHGYSQHNALAMMQDFLKQLGPSEYVQYALLSSHIYYLTESGAAEAAAAKVS